MIIRFNVPLHQSRKINDLSDQYNTIQYNTIQYNTLQYNTIQYNTIQYNTIQYNTIQYNIEGIREELKNRTWNEKLSSIFEQDYEVFVDTLVSALKSHTPLQTPPQKKRNIYMSKETLRLKNTKVPRYLSTRPRYDRKKYTRCKNSLTALTRKLRQSFEQCFKVSILRED